MPARAGLLSRSTENAGLDRLSSQPPELEGGLRDARESAMKQCSSVAKGETLFHEGEPGDRFVVRPGERWGVDMTGSGGTNNARGLGSIFGGVLKRFPRIKFCMSHGGGFQPYQTGRFMHGWASLM